MGNEKNLKSVKAGIIVAAVTVFVAAFNLVMSSFLNNSVFFWVGLAMLFSALTLLFANIVSYRKKKKQLVAAEKIQKGID